jgi:hypothetical protein
LTVPSQTTCLSATSSCPHSGASVSHEALRTRPGKLLVRDVADRRSEAGFGTSSDASTVAVRLKGSYWNPPREEGRRGTRKLNIQGPILGCVGRVCGGGTEETHMVHEKPVWRDVLHNTLMSPAGKKMCTVCISRDGLPWR